MTNQPDGSPGVSGEAAAEHQSQFAGSTLDGVRVLDLTNFLSGPYATQILADLGADIIKVEPLDGDSSRGVPPHFVDGTSAYYLGANRGKRSIAIDLKQPSGLAAVRRIMATVDVVIENYRPGVAQRLGLDVAEIRSERPDLVWASISGFGQTGPSSRLPAYDMIVQASSGVMSLTGEPGRPAVRLGIPAGDTVAGMYAVIGILAALNRRSRDGVGATLDVAMLDCQLSMISYQAVYSTVGGVTPQPQGARHDSIPTYRSFLAGDGREFVVTANSQGMWVNLCDALGLEDLPRDPRFLNAAARLQHREELWALLEDAFLAKSAAAWVSELQKVSVPCALIQTVPEALATAREAGRDMVIRLTDERGNAVDVVGDPIKFAHRSDVESPRYPPRLGQHTIEILRECGGSEEEIGHILASGGARVESSAPGAATQSEASTVAI